MDKSILIFYAKQIFQQMVQFLFRIWVWAILIVSWGFNFHSDSLTCKKQSCNFILFLLTILFWKLHDYMISNLDYILFYFIPLYLYSFIYFHAHDAFLMTSIGSEDNKSRIVLTND